MIFLLDRNTHRFIPANNRPEDLWVFFVYIRFLVMQGFKGIFSIFSLGKQFYDLKGNIYSSIHSFNSNVLIRPVIGMSAGSQIRAGKSHET